VFGEVSFKAMEPISGPDAVETLIVTLNVLDGILTDNMTDRLYDNLDRLRGWRCFSTT
jgi:hypothetical protein